ncbi:flagellin N-terminal helical domain-containing protein [Agrobacterium pusense]|uniref:flagellin N-terminal helical domain-containing protein n=1 Tax=Agrobacterium pusense TaxID=648995 RepID=UPI003FD45272
MTALNTLRRTDTQLTDTSQQMSSGLRVAVASDNAAYWSISTSMRSDVGAMETVTDSLGLAMGIVDTAYAAMETVRQSFLEIRNLATTASDMPQPRMKDAIKPTFSLAVGRLQDRREDTASPGPSEGGDAVGVVRGREHDLPRQERSR